MNSNDLARTPHTIKDPQILRGKQNEQTETKVTLLVGLSYLVYVQNGSSLCDRILTQQCIHDV